jgi:hypothetical protein
MHMHSNKVILIHVDYTVCDCAVCGVWCTVCGTLIHIVCDSSAAVCGSTRCYVATVWQCAAVRLC